MRNIVRINTLTSYKKKESQLFRYSLAGIAAVILLSLFIIKPQIIKHKTTNLSISAINEIVKDSLQDKSSIKLNKNSSVFYGKNFGKINREISLKGEAFFAVTKNSEIPFIVKIKNGAVKVLGTKFNIKESQTGDTCFVSVFEGIVSVLNFNSGKEVILHKGESASIFTNSISLRPYSENDRSWDTGKILFYNTSLIDVSKVLADYYNKRFIISDDILTQIQITATFENNSIEEVIDILKKTLQINVDMKENSVFLSKRND